MKHIIILGDGMADWPVKSLGDKPIRGFFGLYHGRKIASLFRRGLSPVLAVLSAFRTATAK